MHTHRSVNVDTHTQCYYVIFKLVISSSDRGQMKILLKPGEIGLSLLVGFFKTKKSGGISALRIYVLDLKVKKGFSSVRQLQMG